MKPDPFYTLKDLVEMRVFGKKSAGYLQRIARLQYVDRSRYTKTIRVSWCVVDSYPRFVREGRHWGLYESQIREHRERKMGIAL